MAFFRLSGLAGLLLVGACTTQPLPGAPPETEAPAPAPTHAPTPAPAVEPAVPAALPLAAPAVSAPQRMTVRVGPGETVPLFASAHHKTNGPAQPDPVPVFYVCVRSFSSMPVDIILSPSREALGASRPSNERMALAPGECLFVSAADIDAAAPEDAKRSVDWLKAEIAELEEAPPSKMRDFRLSNLRGLAEGEQSALVTFEPARP